MSTTPYRERPRASRPAFPRVWVAALVMLGSAWLLAFTTRKLAVMSQLRGWTPGIPTREVILRSEARRFNPTSSEYEARDAGGNAWRIQLTHDQAASIGYGTTLTVRCLELEHECFVPGSVYVSDGNFDFDRMLQGVEFLGLLAAALRIAWRVFAWRRELAAWKREEPPAAA